MGPADYDLTKDVLRVFLLGDGKAMPDPAGLLKGTGKDSDKNVVWETLADPLSSKEIYIANLGHWAVPIGSRLIFQIHPPTAHGASASGASICAPP